MFHKFPFALLAAVLVLTAHLFGSAATAQHARSSVAGFIAVGGKKLSFHDRSKQQVQRHYFAPKSKHSAKKHAYQPKKAKKPHHYLSFKRHKSARYPYKSSKRHGHKPHRRHGHKSFKFKKKFHYKGY